MQGTTLAMLWPDIGHAILACFAIGPVRTPVQDVRFPLQQLVEIAVRALSPSTSDPFTALACIDRIASALRLMAARDVPATLHADPDGTPRVLAPAVGFDDLLHAACHPIRQHARGNVLVLVRLLEAIAQVAASAARPADLKALNREADALWRAGGMVSEPDDRDAIQRAYLAAVAATASRRDARATRIARLP